MAPYRLAQKFSMALLKFSSEIVVGPKICRGPVFLLWERLVKSQYNQWPRIEVLRIKIQKGQNNGWSRCKFPSPLFPWFLTGPLDMRLHLIYWKKKFNLIFNMIDLLLYENLYCRFFPIYIPLFVFYFWFKIHLDMIVT